MRQPPRFLLLLPVLASLAATGCGGGHAKSASGAGTSSPADALGARNLAAGDFAGYQRAHFVMFANATAWAAAQMLPPAQAATETARLKRIGFVAAESQHLQTTDGSQREGLLVVEQFGSPAGARADAATQYAQQTAPSAGGPVKPFGVPGVPGARAYEATSPQFGGLNIIFADGRYYYLVGAGWPAKDPHPPTRALVITAAQHLYQRVHGLPGG
jgi:hypothetical protein